MKILIVYAHPNPASLNGALRDHAVAVLRSEGHEVKISDLYAVKWKAVADGDDFPHRSTSSPLDLIAAQGEAYQGGTQAKDIAAEQEKLLWADAVVFQFPLWWFGVPAILKGWFERVYAYGFAYGYKDGTNAYRYGEGILAGKRALVSVTTGGPEADYGPRGINGPLDQLLFPLMHGALFYPGMDVLPVFAVYGAMRLDGAGVAATKLAFEKRLTRLFVDEPIRFRRQNGGAYPDRHTLASNVAAEFSGFPAHIDSEAAVASIGSYEIGVGDRRSNPRQSQAV
jgi:NAD(P)H dehydrogenase (quinone)